jgi:hypothetical protein
MEMERFRFEMPAAAEVDFALEWMMLMAFCCQTQRMPTISLTHTCHSPEQFCVHLGRLYSQIRIP